MNENLNFCDENHRGIYFKGDHGCPICYSSHNQFSCGCDHPLISWDASMGADCPLCKAKDGDARYLRLLECVAAHFIPTMGDNS